MSDGFSFPVRYACHTCHDCPDFHEAFDRHETLRRYCLQDGGPKDFTTVWVTDEIHPDCPHRKPKEINDL